MRTSLGSLLDICKSEYRRLLDLPGCHERVLHFVRTMRAARQSSLCPLMRATAPVLSAMGDMDCRETQTLVLEGKDIPALLQGVIQSSSHCFNFRESFLASDGGVRSYYRCMYADRAGIQPGGEMFHCSCGAINAKSVTASTTAPSRAAKGSDRSSALPPQPAALLAGSKRRATVLDGGTLLIGADSAPSAPATTVQAPATAVQEAATTAQAATTAAAQRIHRSLETRADPRPCRCDARGCTGRLSVIVYPGFNITVIRRTPHSTHGSKSPGSVARDSRALPLHPATMIYGLQMFSPT